MSLAVLEQLFGMVVLMGKDFQLYTIYIYINISKQQLKTRVRDQQPLKLMAPVP